MKNNKFRKRAFLTIFILLGMVSMAGSNQTYTKGIPIIYTTSIEQSLDSLSKVLDYVKIKESNNPSSSNSPTE